MAANGMSSTLNPAPLGLDPMNMGDEEEGQAYELADDAGDGATDSTNQTELPDGSVEITLETSVTPLNADPDSFDANLAESMSESELATMASDLVELVDADIASRKDWVEMLVKGLEVLGMKYEERTEPWNGACGVFSTVLTEAAVRFQSETIMETFPAAGPVKTEIIGAIDKLKEEAAARVADDMNYELTERMPEYRPEHERMLYALGLAGAAFKKVYKDPALGRQASMFVPAEDLIMPYGCSSILTCERVTHVMRKTKNDVAKLQAAGFYRDVDLGEPVAYHSDIEKKKAEEQGYTLTDDDRYQVLEVHVDYEVESDPLAGDDEIARPYVVTIERGTNKVLSVYRNWDQDDPLMKKREHFVQYTYIPGMGAYGLGLIHLIGGYARAGTMLIRQLVDAGTLSNLPGGLKSRGMRIKGDDTPIAPGEFRDVDVPSGSVKDNIMALPYKEPSQVLAGLLDKITDEGRRLGSIADMSVSDMSANAPVGTTLALLERQLKTMSAVQARVHYSMKQEFKLLKAIIRDSKPLSYDYDPQDGDRQVKQSDYDMVEVIPVSDPNNATMAQRIMQYQAAMAMAKDAPQIYDLAQLHRQMLEVLGIKNAEKLVPTDDDLTPRDPVSENMAFLNGKPTKAFIVQDHDAHIAVHSALMQDPLIQQQIGQNPQAQQMQAAIMAHISEHLAFAYRKKVEDALGVPLPAPDTEMDPEVEAKLSGLVAQAAQQVLAQSKSQAQQAQAQQQAQDPVFQLQQQELEVKKADSATKAKKVEGDLALKAQELAIKGREVASKAVETPEMLRERHMLEMQHADQKHQQSMVHNQQNQQLKATQQAQASAIQNQRAAMAPMVPPAGPRPPKGNQ